MSQNGAASSPEGAVGERLSSRVGNGWRSCGGTGYPAQIDRLLAPKKAKAGAKGRWGTKPEQKNWTRVRQLLGYGRLEDPSLLPATNELCWGIWDSLQNFFMPSTELVS